MATTTLTKAQLFAKLSKQYGKENVIDTGKTIRVEVPTRKTEEREREAFIIAKTYKGKLKAKKTEISFNSFSLVVKPKAAAAVAAAKKTTVKTPTRVYYGFMSKLNLKDFDRTSFRDIDATFCESGKLPRTLKEKSDVIGVSDFNKKLEKIMTDSNGVDLKICNFTIKCVVGAIAIVGSEPKADFVLVSKVKNKLTPSFYVSYKLGSNAKGFQNYSGISKQASTYIWESQETKDFFKLLKNMEKNKRIEDVKQEISDDNIIFNSVYGKDYGKDYGADNVQILAQGNVNIDPNGNVTYEHTIKNGNNLKTDKNYCPVFGARTATGRTAKTPTGETITGFRIGIFPRAYRTAWLTQD
jgi:hypothetical protein